MSRHHAGDGVDQPLSAPPPGADGSTDQARCARRAAAVSQPHGPV